MCGDETCRKVETDVASRSRRRRPRESGSSDASATVEMSNIQQTKGGIQRDTQSKRHTEGDTQRETVERMVEKREGGVEGRINERVAKREKAMPFQPV